MEDCLGVMVGVVVGVGGGGGWVLDGFDDGGEDVVDVLLLGEVYAEYEDVSQHDTQLLTQFAPVIVEPKLSSLQLLDQIPSEHQ